jgi:hypothetical protein
MAAESPSLPLCNRLLFPRARVNAARVGSSYVTNDMLCYMQWFAADRCMLLDSKLSKARSDWRGAVQHSIVQRACAADCCSMTGRNDGRDLSTLPRQRRRSMRSTTDSGTVSKSRCGPEVYAVRNTLVECAYPRQKLLSCPLGALPSHSGFEGSWLRMTVRVTENLPCRPIV